MFMSLLELGLPVLTNKAGAGTELHDAAFSHFDPTANGWAGPGLDSNPGLGASSSGSEQITINSPLWIDLTI